MRSAIVFHVCSMLALAGSAACERSVAPDPGAPAAVSPVSEGLPDRDPALARRLVAEGALLLDVRTPEEFASGHVEGAVNVPIGELDERMHEIEALTGGDESKPIVVYCSSGRRSGMAKDKLLAAGYEQVTNLGGIDDWYR
jgi:phage shock protein E